MAYIATRGLLLERAEEGVHVETMAAALASPAPTHKNERSPKKGTAQEKSARLHARLSERQRDILEQAAAIEGRTLTDFVLTHAQEAAQRTIREHTLLSLSARDSAAFIEALLAPWTPSPALSAEIAEMRALFDGD